MASTYKQPRNAVTRAALGERLTHVLSNFDGVDNSNDPSSITENMSPDTLNTILDSVGSIENRQGYIKLLTTKTPVPTNNGWPYYKSDGTKQLVYRAGQYLYRYDNAGGSIQVGGPWNASTADDADVYQDILYGVDGNQLYSYNGSTSTIQAPAGVFTAPQYLRVHKNRVWIAQGSNIYFSDAGSPTSFPVVNYIQVNSNDNQVITGLEVNLDRLIIFKTDSVWVITGEPLGSGTNTTIGNLNLQRFNSDVGCVAYRTIKKVESVIFFMARSGLYVLQNNQTSLISQPVNGTFRQDMNPNAQYLSWALYSPVQKKYILGYTSGASNTPDKAIVYDTLVRHYTIWDHIPAQWATNFRFQQIESALIGDSTVGNIYQLFQGYADIAGDTGTVSTATTTTITDTTKTWTTNQFVDCRIQIYSGTTLISTATITANTSTTLTFTSMIQPVIGSTYVIGGYLSYWKSKILDFDAPDMRKRYKYWKIFADSEAAYSLQIGVSLDFAPLSFNLPALPLSISSRLWDDGLGPWWDQAYNWDTKNSLYKRVGLPGQGRFIQFIFGNYYANQPWRVFEHSVEYKNKKASAN